MWDDDASVLAELGVLPLLGEEDAPILCQIYCSAPPGAPLEGMRDSDPRLRVETVKGCSFKRAVPDDYPALCWWHAPDPPLRRANLVQAFHAVYKETFYQHNPDLLNEYCKHNVEALFPTAYIPFFRPQTALDFRRRVKYLLLHARLKHKPADKYDDRHMLIAMDQYLALIQSPRCLPPLMIASGSPANADLKIARSTIAQHLGNKLGNVVMDYRLFLASFVLMVQSNLIRLVRPVTRRKDKELSGLARQPRVAEPANLLEVLMQQYAPELVSMWPEGLTDWMSYDDTGEVFKLPRSVRSFKTLLNLLDAGRLNI